MKLSVKEAGKIKLQIFISHNSRYSRRKAMDLIFEGHVRVDGRMVKEPSVLISPDKNIVCVDGERIEGSSFQYVLLNKPSGHVTTREDRLTDKTVFDLLPKELHHLSPVGRLDKETEGLLLFTNDGSLAYTLTHPKFNVDKTYFVCIDAKLNDSHTKLVEKGFLLDGKRTSPARINQIKFLNSATEFNLTIHEGRKRQIRLMFEKLGYKVVYLKRVAQGPLELGDLKKGEWRELRREEVEALKKAKNDKNQMSEYFSG